MDWITIRRKVAEYVERYKYVAVVVAIGIVLMMLPGKQQQIMEPEPTLPQRNSQSIDEELEDILSRIHGVGEVEVMITEATGAETLFQTDEDSSISADSQSIREETVIISDADREEYGLVRQVNPPSYHGALVVCEGAERPSIQLAVVEAVSNVTGIPANRITVLKMK